MVNIGFTKQIYIPILLWRSKVSRKKSLTKFVSNYSSIFSIWIRL